MILDNATQVLTLRFANALADKGQTSVYATCTLTEPFYWNIYPRLCKLHAHPLNLSTEIIFPIVRLVESCIT